MDEPEQRWARVRGALRSEVARVGELFRSIQDGRAPDGPGVGSWSGGDVAMHLSQTWIALPGLARGDLAEVDAVVPGRAPAGASLIGTLDDLGPFTMTAVPNDPERDLRVLAERIEARAEVHLADCARGSAHDRRPWLVDGVTVPLPVFSAHLLNETVVHGYDVARAAGRPWRIDPVHAGLVVDEFMMALAGEAAGALPGRRPPPSSVQARFELRVRGGRRHRLRLVDGAPGLDPDPSPPDCRMSVDPVAMLLVFYRRRRLAAAVARGEMVAWGRRPWLAAHVLGSMPAP